MRTDPAESTTQAAILAALGSGHAARLWRNNVGKAWQGDVTRVPGGILIRNPRLVTFGLCEGSSDLIGYAQTLITPEHLGQTMARFLAVEVKRPRGSHQRELQLRYINHILTAGGLAGVAHSVEEALAILQGG